MDRSSREATRNHQIFKYLYTLENEGEKYSIDRTLEKYNEKKEVEREKKDERKREKKRGEERREECSFFQIQLILGTSVS